MILRQFCQPCAKHEYIDRDCPDCGWLATVIEEGELKGEFHATAELEEGEIRLTLYHTADPGPLKEWQPILTFPTDEAHATELLGTLMLALKQRRDV